MFSSQIKPKLKQYIKRQINRKTLLNIDFVFVGAEETVLLGWLINREASTDEAGVLSFSANNQLVTHQFSFKRSDVEARHNIKADEECFGFMLVVESGVGALDTMVLAYGDKKFSLNKQQYSAVSHLNEIIAHAGSDPEKAREFLTGCGVDFKATASKTSRPSRKLDKDIEKIKSALNALNIHGSEFINDCTHAVLPEIQKIWKARQLRKNNAVLNSYGEHIDSPKLSIIVPLYGRYDFMQHQLAHFSNDPAMRDVELIYVLDDPPLTHEVSVTAFGLYQSFGQPFKVVLSEHNLGFAGANNLGASYATGEHLLLLNSDIIPTKSGWVTDYLSQFSALEDCAILGATLVYEDNTVQHAGMEFRQDTSYPGIWMNHHPYKGVPLSLVERKGASEVQLVTGASMLMKKALFDEVGGFDMLYVLGDFEDSDLCLKSIDKGLKIYVSHDVVMYHLERLSQDLVDSGDWKFKLTLANGVYQANKWRALIEEVSA